MRLAQPLLLGLSSSYRRDMEWNRLITKLAFLVALGCTAVLCCTAPHVSLLHTFVFFRGSKKTVDSNSGAQHNDVVIATYSRYLPVEEPRNEKREMRNEK